MGFTDTMKNTGRGILGNPQKGYLLIGRKTPMPEPTATNTPTTSGGGIAGAAKNLKSKIGSGASSVKNAAKNALNASASFANVGFFDVNSGSIDKLSETYVPIEVQYNPSSIRMTTRKGSIMNRNIGGEGSNNVQQMTAPLSTTMAVDLIFNKMNLRNAFPLDVDSVASISGIKDIGAWGANKIGTDGYTVRPIVEFVLGSLTSASTRNVMFVWNNMAFSGELSGVNVEYTMFNNQGEPIRAKVSIEIFKKGGLKPTAEEVAAAREAAQKAGKEYVPAEIKEDEAYWREAYERMLNQK